MAKRYPSAKSPFAVVDLGSSRFACLIAEIGAEGKPSLLGQAIHAAEGIRQGEITDMARFSTTLGRVVEAAESNAGITIDSLHIVTPAGQPRLCEQLAEITIGSQIIGRRDIRRLAEKQQEQTSQLGFAVCQRQTREYLIDGLGQIANPLGMTGQKLGLAYHDLMMAQASHNNFCEAVQQNHLKAGHVYHSAAAAGLSCLTEDERELGTLIIDFGGGTTSFALYSEDKLCHVGSIRMGGQNITRDIAKMLSIPTNDAERLKAVEGSALPEMATSLALGQSNFPASGDNFVLSKSLFERDMLTLVTGQTIERAFLNDIIRSRLEEILDMIDQQLSQAGMRPAPCYNLAITGGASQLTGLQDFVSGHWGKPVAMKVPQSLFAADSQISGGSFAAAIGMAMFVQRLEETRPQDPTTRYAGTGLWARLRLWFKQNL